MWPSSIILHNMKTSSPFRYVFILFRYDRHLSISERRYLLICALKGGTCNETSLTGDSRSFYFGLFIFTSPFE